MGIIDLIPCRPIVVGAGVSALLFPSCAPSQSIPTGQRGQPALQHVGDVGLCGHRFQYTGAIPAECYPLLALTPQVVVWSISPTLLTCAGTG